MTEAGSIAAPNSARAFSIASLSRLALYMIIVVIFATPYLWIAGSTFKTRQDLFDDLYPVSVKTFLPSNPTLENLTGLFTQTKFAQAFLNSVLVAAMSVTFAVTFNSMIAFVLAWLKFPGRRLLFLVILATLTIAFEAKLIPLFLTMQQLRIDNTLPSIFLPWITDAFIIFLLRQHFAELPQDLYDAAIIDGCSFFRMYWQVMLPNIVPALVSAAFIKFIFSWDSFIWPSIVITDESKTVITVALAKLFSDEYIRWELVFAGSFVATVPVVVIFVFLQRYYVQGFVRSGLK